MEATLLTIAQVNALGRHGFVATFGEVLESSPHLAATTWERRPFADRDALAEAFAAAVAALDDDAALTLLRAHPVLGATGPMAPASVDEQAAAGFQGLDQELRSQIAADNATYRERFGFPFILAVHGLGTADIAAALSQRLANPLTVELATALEQVQRIAALRLARLVTP